MHKARNSLTALSRWPAEHTKQPLLHWPQSVLPLLSLQALCKPIVDTVSHHINSQYIELTAHRLLSIFKMAEVQVMMQAPNAAISLVNNNRYHYCNSMLFILHLLSLLFLSICPFVRWSLYTGNYRLAPSATTAATIPAGGGGGGDDGDSCSGQNSSTSSGRRRWYGSTVATTWH